MIIDFHTHTFPDKIADKAIASLAERGGITPCRAGTLASLKESTKAAGIDYSVVLPVATAPRQVESINNLSAAENGRDGIIFSGAIHPDCEDIDGILDGIKAAGLFGIKIHPDYQGVYFDDERYIRIIDGAARRGLITVTHAGLDVAYPDDIHCTPDRILRTLDALGGVADGKLVLAHLGGYSLSDEVIQKIAGRDVYLDTAVVLDRYSPETIKAIIDAHGTDKVLFATDSPWADQKKFVEIFSSLGFSDAELEMMFSGNARKLLGQFV